MLEGKIEKKEYGTVEIPQELLVDLLLKK